jgi:hypothetical protein
MSAKTTLPIVSESRSACKQQGSVVTESDRIK